MGNTKSKMDVIGQIADKMTDCATDEDVRSLWKLVTTYHSQNHSTAFNLISGIPSTGDRVLYHHWISSTSVTLGWRQQSISFPPKYSTNVKKVIISGIAILDVKNNRLGGEATIESGGIGHEFVEISMTSKFCRNMSFCLVVFGRYVTEDHNKAIHKKDNNVLTKKNNLQ